MMRGAWTDLHRGLNQRQPTGAYYDSGPRVAVHNPLDRYFRWGPDLMPKPGELEYLALGRLEAGGYVQRQGGRWQLKP